MNLRRALLLVTVLLLVAIPVWGSVLKSDSPPDAIKSLTVEGADAAQSSLAVYGPQTLGPFQTATLGPATIEVNGRPLAFTQRTGYSIRRAALFDRNGNRVGRSHLLCFWISKDERDCRGTYVFPRGVIAVAGLVQVDSYVLAVVGGTGLYNNARGAMRVAPSGAQSAHRIFFQLVG